MRAESVLKLYAEFMEEGCVSKRALGIAFVSGNITRKWLEQILLKNAAELCEGSLVVQVLEWRGIESGFQMRRIRNFPSRSALIETLFASCHIPFLLDGRPWTTLTITEGDLPHGTFKALDTVIIALLKMNESE